MEGLTVNHASATPHDGGSSWTVDSLVIGEPLDQYTFTYFPTEIKPIKEFEELYFVVRVLKGNNQD